MGRFLTPSPRKLQLAQIYIGGNSGARGGGGGGHMAKRLGDPIIYGDATPPVFSCCPPQLCLLNNNRLDIHLTCVCSTIKDLHLYCAGVHNNPRQHFIQSIFRAQYQCRAVVSYELAIIDKFDRNVTPLSERNNKSWTTQVQCLPGRM